MDAVENYVNEKKAACDEFQAFLNPGKGYSDRSSLVSSMTQFSGASGRGYPNGSEINFNRSSQSSYSNPVKQGGAKHYDDKIIPGTETPLNSVVDPYSPNQHSVLPSQLSNIGTTDPGFSSNRSTKSSLPNDSLFGESSSSTNGADALRRMLDFTMISEPKSSTSNGSDVQRQDSENRSSEHDFSMKFDMKANFTYKKLQQGTDNFAAHHLLGEGAFGTVYKGNIDHMECAVKLLNKAENESADQSSQMMSELTALLKYQHENIVTLYGYALDGPHLCLVYQYLREGSLEDRLSRKNGTPPLPWERRLNILVGVAKGLNFLHTIGQTPLLHGDIKSANILLDKYFEAKLGDLGQAQYATSSSQNSSGFTHITMAQTSTKQFASKAYIAPELVSTGHLSTKSDVYAMGVVYLEVLTGCKPYDQFRAELFLAHEVKKVTNFEPDKKCWVEKFRDKNADDLSDDVFVDVIKIALKCVLELRKQRPDSIKLLNEMKTVYDKYMSLAQENSQPPSMHESSSSTGSMELQISSSTHSMQGQSDISCSQVGSSHSCYQSHTSQPLHSVELMGAAHDSHLALVPTNSNPGTSFHHHCFGPVNLPLPVSFRLQAAYDKQAEKKVIDRLSTLSAPSMCVNLTPNKDTSNQCTEHFPEADPEKLAKLLAFDNQTMGVDESRFADLPADPNKMAMLQNIDDSVDIADGEHSGQTNSLTSQVGVAHQPQQSHTLQCHELHSVTNAQVSCDEQGNHLHNEDRRASDIDNNATDITGTPSIEAQDHQQKRDMMFAQYEQMKMESNMLGEYGELYDTHEEPCDSLESSCRT